MRSRKRSQAIRTVKIPSEFMSRLPWEASARESPTTRRTGATMPPIMMEATRARREVFVRAFRSQNSPELPGAILKAGTRPASTPRIDPA
jgi:hypothetical protein